MLSFLKGNKSDPSQPDASPAEDGWLTRLKAGLSATRGKLSTQLSTVLGRHGKIDEALFEELETLLLSCDVGVASTAYLLDRARRRAARDQLTDPRELKRILRDSLVELLQPVAKPLSVAAHTPFVLLMVGVNGSGKTTSHR